MFEDLELDLLPEGSTVFADKGYADYDHEDLLREAGGLHPKARRKENPERPMPAWEEFSGKPLRRNTPRRSSAGRATRSPGRSTR